MMVRRSIALHLILAAVLLGYCVSASASAFKSFDFPGATETVLNDINNKNTAVGYYLDQSGIAHGFLATQGGHLTSIDFPDSTATYAYGINDTDQIVGWYVDSLGTEHGYVYRSGQFTTIDPPNSTDTRAWDISNGNDIIVGTYFDPAYEQYRGFSYEFGRYGGYDPPGSIHTEIHGTDSNTANIVGIYFTDTDSVEHGFLVSGGVLVDITHKGSAVTTADRVDPGGGATTNVVGSYAASDSGPFSGYGIKKFFQGKLIFITLTYPEATDTRILGLNDAHWLVGRYTDAVGSVHGFVFIP